LYLLEAACDKAQSVLLDQVFFGLDDTNFREFTAISTIVLVSFTSTTVSKHRPHIQ
jgi:hypothetical protein